MKKSILTEIKSFNTIEDLNKFKEEVNNEIKTREEVISICEAANSIKGKSFGYIKESMETLLPMIFSMNEGKSLLKRYISIIKENSELKKLHNYYENLDQINENTDAVRVVSEIKNMMGPLNKKKVNEGLRKLDKVLSEAFIWAGKDSEKLLPNSDKEKYYVLAENVLYTSPKAKELTDYYNNISSIKETSVKLNEERNRKMNDVYKILMDNANNSISVNSEGLSEEYNKAKDKCLKTLSEAKNNFEKAKDFESSARIELYIESVSNKNFNKETVTEDIQKLNELETCFK